MFMFSETSWRQLRVLKKITSGKDPPAPNTAGGSVVCNAMPLGLLLFLLAEILIFSTFFSLLHSVIIYQNREPQIIEIFCLLNKMTVKNNET